jgi:hypothetical protein
VQNKPAYLAVGTGLDGEKHVLGIWLAKTAPDTATARRAQTGKRSDQPARLVEGQRVMGWREALNELDTAYPGRLR